MVKSRLPVYIDREDLRIAKGIASFKGITLKEYFRGFIDEDAKKFKQEIASDQSIYRRRNR